MNWRPSAHMRRRKGMSQRQKTDWRRRKVFMRGEDVLLYNYAYSQSSSSSSIRGASKLLISATNRFRSVRTSSSDSALNDDD